MNLRLTLKTSAGFAFGGSLVMIIAQQAQIRALKRDAEQTLVEAHMLGELFKQAVLMLDRSQLKEIQTKAKSDIRFLDVVDDFYHL